MFRPAQAQDELAGDFDTPSQVRSFSRDQVEFVVGNRWEQVYARMIDGEYYPLPAKWLITARKWVPYKVDSWHETPMSERCNGCHTTGFDATTYEFNEYSIGCEACHGPGREHSHNESLIGRSECSLCHDLYETNQRRGDIIRTVAPSVCAQCHDRGSNTGSSRAKEGTFNFPVNYRPGEDIQAAFSPIGPEDDNKGKYWWGIGVSKNRHQEYADWNLSEHSRALEHLLTVGVDACSGAGLDEHCLHCHSTDYRHAPEDRRPDLDNARYGVTCSACHDPHGIERQSTRSKSSSDTCAGCHMAAMAAEAAQSGTTHFPCPQTRVQCADCHMPRVVKTGGGFNLHSHAFRIIPPSASIGTGMPNSCDNGGCHQDKSLDWLIEAFDEHFLRTTSAPADDTGGKNAPESAIPR